MKKSLIIFLRFSEICRCYYKIGRNKNDQSFHDKWSQCDEYWKCSIVRSDLVDKEMLKYSLRNKIDFCLFVFVKRAISVFFCSQRKCSEFYPGV